MGSGAVKSRMFRYVPAGAAEAAALRPQELPSEAAAAGGGGSASSSSAAAKPEAGPAPTGRTGSASTSYSSSGTGPGAERPAAPHLSAAPVKVVKKLALLQDKVAVQGCVEKQDLMDLLVSRLGVDVANRQAYEERPDVREALALAAMLQRMAMESHSLLAAVEERREYAEVCVTIAQRTGTAPEDEEKIKKAAAEAQEQMVTIGSIIENIEKEASAMCMRIEESYDRGPGHVLEPVKPAAMKSLELLASLAPTAQGLGDFRSWMPAGTTATSTPRPEATTTSTRTWKLGEIERLLKAHDVGEKSPRAKAEEESARQERERLAKEGEDALGEIERKELEAENQELLAELEDLARRQKGAEAEDEAHHENETDLVGLSSQMEDLLREQEAIDADLERQLLSMCTVLDMVEEERHTQVAEVRRLQQRFQLDTMTHKMTDAGNVSRPATVPGDVGLGSVQSTIHPDDIEFKDDRDFLGAGAQGVVRKGVMKQTRQEVAIKTITLDSAIKRTQLVSEIEGLVQAQGCPFLVQWLGRCDTQISKTVHVVLEYMDLGSLSDLKARRKDSPLDARWMWHIIEQMVGGLDFLHSKRLLHRDIKPQNTLHNRAGEVKLTDFGISKHMNASVAANTCVGTSLYLSPERCGSEEYGFPADIWGAGVVFHEMATGHHPFASSKSFIEVWNQLQYHPEPRLDPAEHDPELCDFLAACLERDLAKRSKIAGLKTHPFLAKARSSRQEFAEWLQSLPDS